MIAIGMNPLMTVLYITYDGVLEPLGQSQVVNYLERLAPSRKILLISYEKKEDWRDQELRRRMSDRLAAAGIEWYPLRYHKRLSVAATLFDVLVGVWVAIRKIRSDSVSIVHARSYVASIIALTAKKISGVAYVFDMRGFWVDERVDGGLWPAGGVLYRTGKWFERRFLLNADWVISLTMSAIVELKRLPYLQASFPRFSVIPTCTDLDVFRPSTDFHPRQAPEFVLGWVGSVGTWYLFDDALRLYQEIRVVRRDAKLLVLNKGDHEWIAGRVRELGLSGANVVVREASPQGVADAMREMDAGVFFIKPAYSKVASAPTKLGEFLGCGVPCACNGGVGDFGRQVQDAGVGVVLSGFGKDDFEMAARNLIEMAGSQSVRIKCRAEAEELFSLNEGVEAYSKVYEALEC